MRNILLTNDSDPADSEEYSNENQTSSTWNKLKYKFFTAFIGFAILMLYIFHIRSLRLQNRPGIFKYKYTHVTGIKDEGVKFSDLVSNEYCTIPDFDPNEYPSNISFVRYQYEPCSPQSKPLTRVIYNAARQRYTLQIIKENIRFFTKSGFVNCSYQSVYRNERSLDPDSDIWYSKFVHFVEEAHLASTIDNIIVKCKVRQNVVYHNGHAMMPERNVLRKHINKWKSKDIKNQQNATSVIMIGIDSLSRINLKRSMPKLAKYLYDGDWFELSGYNKIDDNTFPNIMGILTGFNLATVYRKCLNGTKYLDKCNSIIWNTFREHGYVTAYGEDETSINTFVLKAKGFKRQPVDYYLRPFLLMAEKSLKIRVKEKIRCIGGQDTSDIIFDYAQELVKRFKHDPYFGLFWMSSFSHDRLNDPTSMDEHILESLHNFMTLVGLDNTMVIFFSDHGLRFGPNLRTLLGYYEERLPFMFIWLPPKLRQSHPEFINALGVNKNRLTCPYDLHMTLKHILALSKRVENPARLAPAEDCPRCQTLLAPVPHNRSCDDVAIDFHWCTCIPYQQIQSYTQIEYKLVNVAIDYINHIVTDAFADFCRRLSLRYIDSAFHAYYMVYKSDDFYRFNFYTAPGNGLFSVSIQWNQFNGNLKILGPITRLNAYSNDAYCIDGDPEEKKFCSCR